MTIADFQAIVVIAVTFGLIIWYVARKSNDRK